MKKRHKILLIIISALVLIGIIYLGTIFVKHRYGVSYREKLTSSLTLIEYNNEQKAILNSAGKIICKRFDEIYHYEDNSLSFAIKRSGKWGFISKSGAQICPPKFDEVWLDNPKIGLAAVVLNGKIGFLDVRRGQMKIEPQWEDTRYCCYGFMDNGMCRIKHNSKLGLIDTLGRVILPCLYDNISFLEHGFIELELNGKSGLCDSTLRSILPIIYDRLEITSLGIIVTELDYSKGHRQYLLDYNGKDVLNTLWIDIIGWENFVIPFYESTSEEYYGSDDDDDSNKQKGSKTPYSKFCIDCRYGVFDMNFKVVIPALYEDIKYENGYFVCSLNGHGVIVNQKGQLVHGK